MPLLHLPKTRSPGSDAPSVSGFPSLAPAERRCAYLEGAATSVFRNLAGVAFMVPFALALGAGPLHIGLIGAAPFVGRVMQLLASSWAQGVGARAAAIRTGLAERAVVAAVASLPFWFHGSPAAPWIVVAMLCVSATSGEGYTVASAVWYAERVPASRLGRFAAARTRWASWTGFAASLA
ncbi:MAG: hypothetical protein M3409_04840, partial [Gemmatimonadota bacterium]|nr:hypothetical protein [Gemmatimonadota bacterium]